MLASFEKTRSRKKILEMMAPEEFSSVLFVNLLWFFLQSC